MPTQPIPRLTSRQSWCISSDSVVYPIGRGEDVIPANLYKHLLGYVLGQECSIELVNELFLRNEIMVQNTSGVKHVYAFLLSVWKDAIFCVDRKHSFMKERINGKKWFFSLLFFWECVFEKFCCFLVFLVIFECQKYDWRHRNKYDWVSKFRVFFGVF